MTKHITSSGLEIMNLASQMPPKHLVLGSNSAALIDVFRAAAANLVLFQHINNVYKLNSQIPAGQIGVSVFFILSGFLIFISSLNRVRRPGRHFVTYMVDRSVRIFTAYIPALIFVAVANEMIDFGHTGQAGTSVGSMAFIGNLFLLQDYPFWQVILRTTGQMDFIRSYNTAEPFWTIPIEFSLYVVFGIGFFGVAARERLWHPIQLTIGAIALPVVLWNAVAGGGNGLSLVWVIGAGAGYAWAVHWNRAPAKLQVGLIACFLAAFCLLGRGMKTGWNFEDLGMVMCEALFVLGGISIVDGIPRLPDRVLKACSYMAAYSFSLYLVHNTIIIMAKHFLSTQYGNFPLWVSVVAAHLGGFGCYYLFERQYQSVGRYIKDRIAAQHGSVMTTSVTK